MPQEVTGQEPPNPKDVQIQQLQAEKEQLRQENKLLKEKVDLLIRRLFGVKSEKLDAAQLELLLKEADLGKADASAEKAEAAPIIELTKPVPKRKAEKERRERWPQDLPVEREIIEPVEVMAQPEAFRCIGEEVTETLDYRHTDPIPRSGQWKNRPRLSLGGASTGRRCDLRVAHHSSSELLGTLDCHRVCRDCSM